MLTLYGSECWTLTKELENRIDGCYTRLLRKALNYTWEDYIKNEALYGKLSKATDKIRNHRLKLAGHCVRHPEVIANLDLLWIPKFGRRSQGSPKLKYTDQLKKDTGLSDINELRINMNDRETWKLYQR